MNALRTPAPVRTRPRPQRALLQRRCACGAGAGLSGRCPDCARRELLGLQTKLTVGTADDRFEREADQAAEQVLAGGQRPRLTPLGSAPLQRQSPDEQQAPDPLGEGLGVLGSQLGDNNPAFGAFTTQLADRFLAQPAPISVGIPAFVGANYALLWTVAMVDPAMRRQFDGFNLAMLPGLVPQFPVKTFQYRILDGAQTRFGFEFGLDASALVGAFNSGVVDTRISSLALDSAGRLDTRGSQPLALSALQVQLGLFGDALMLSGGFRQGISPYPLMGQDGSRVMAQTPALPDLYPGQRDLRFTVQLDLFKLGQYLHPATPPRGPERAQRASRDNAPLADDAGRQVQAALASAGTPLDTATRGFMESRFGHDFSQVRIHADGNAAASARAVHAHAYTLGQDIVFDAGRYAPQTDGGRRLLAHELAHVVQQGADSGRLQRQPAPPGQAAASGPCLIHFIKDRAEFTDKGQAMARCMQRAKAFLAAQRGSSTPGSVELHGYASEEGDESSNQALSERRADTVLRLLVQGGLPRARLSASGHGADRKFPTREENRRVELRMITHSQAEETVITAVPCPPTAAITARTMDDYLELLVCAEARMNRSPREMLALFRQLYYGKAWSNSKASQWAQVIPCSPDIGDPRSALGAPLFESLQKSQSVGDTDVGHVFTGLEAMTCPSASVTPKPSPSAGFVTKGLAGAASLLGATTVHTANEDFATWSGDLGSAVAARTGCIALGPKAKSSADCGHRDANQTLEFYLRHLASDADLRGDIDPFVQRAQLLGQGCGGTRQRKLDLGRPVSALFRDYYLDPGSALGQARAHRGRCALQALGGELDASNKLGNRDALVGALAPPIASFAQAFFFKITGSQADQGQSLTMRIADAPAAARWFIRWLERLA